MIKTPMPNTAPNRTTAARDHRTMPHKTIFAADALAGRTAPVTGGGSGIGIAIATTLADAGANVVLASRNQERLQLATKGIDASGGQALAIVTDVREADAVEAAVAAGVAQLDGLDIVIANAAGNFVVPFADMSFNAWRTVVDIDLHGTFHCVKAAYPHLKASVHGGRSRQGEAALTTEGG